MTSKTLALIIQLRDEASAALGKLQGSMGSLQVAAGNLISSGIMAAGQAMVGFGASTIQVASDFEAGMNKFSAAAGDSLGAAGLSVDDFQNKFLELGAKLPVSTTAVQDAAIALIKGGMDPATVAAGGLESSLNFAAAAEMGLADAAELGIKMLGTFGDSNATAAEQSQFLAEAQDLMTKAAGASTVDVDKLGDAMLAAGGQAKAMGVGYADFTTIMGAISKSFGSAAEEGTSYKNMLSRLNPSTAAARDKMDELGLMTVNTGNIMKFLGEHGIQPLGTDLDTLGNQFTEYATAQGWTAKEIGKFWDENFKTSKFFDEQTGAFVGNRAAAELLQNSLGGLTDQQRSTATSIIFGNDASAAAIALADLGAEGYDQFAGAMDKANGVAAQSAALQKGLGVAWDNVKGSLEALQITIGTAVLPVLTELFNGVVSPAINSITALASAIASSTDPWATFIGALNGAVPGLGSVVDFVSTNFIPIVSAIGAMILAVVVPALWAWATAAWTAAGANIAAFWPLYAIIAGIGLAVGLLVAAWQNNWFGIQEIVASVWAYLQPIFAQVGAWLSVNIPIAIAAVVAAFWVIVGAVQTAGTAIQTAFGAAVAWLSGAWMWIQASAAMAWASITAGVSAAGLSIQTAWNAVIAWFSGIWTGIVTSASATWATVSGTIAGVAASVQAGWNVVISWLAGAWATIAGAASAAWATVSSVVGGAIAAVVSVIQTGMGIINTILLAVGNTVLFLGSWAFQGLLNLISPVIAAIVAVVGPPIEFMVGNLVANFQWALEIATTVWNAISSAVSTAATVIVSALTAAGAVIGGALSSAWSAISAGASAAWAAITGTVNSGAAVVTGAATSAGATISGALSSAWAAISAGASAAWATITGAVSSGAAVVTGLATSAGAAISGALSAAWAVISAGASAAWATITGAISAAIAVVVSVLAAGWANAQANATSVWAQIKAAIDTAITGIKTVIQSAIDIVKTIITTAWAVIVAASENNFSQIPQIISNAWTRIKAVFSEGVAAAKATLLGFVGDAMAIGGNIVDGILRGLSGAAGRLAKAAGDMARGALSAVAGVLKISSPSKAFAELGTYSTEGFGVGFVAAIPKVTTNLVNGVSSLMDKIAGAVDKGAQALNAVSSFRGSSGSGLSGFLASIRDLAIQFNDLAVSLGGRILGTATRFAETIGKVTGVLETGVKGLNALADLAAPSRESVALFGNAVALVVGNLATVASWFDAKALIAAVKFAEAAGKILAVVGPAIEALKKLPDLVVPSREAVGQFGGALALLVGNIATIASWFDAKAVAAAAVFSEGAGKMLAMVSAGVDAFSKLADLKPVSAAAIAMFVDLVDTLLRFLEGTAAYFNGEILTALAGFGEGAQKALSFVSGAVEGLTKIGDLRGVSVAAMETFVDMVDTILRFLQGTADYFNGAILTSLASFGEGAQKALSFITAAVDGLTKIGELRPYSVAVLQTFVDMVDTILRFLQGTADYFNGAILTSLASFGEGAQKALSFIGAGVDGLLKISDLQPVSAQAIAMFVDLVNALLVGIAAAAVNFSTEAIAAAGQFADAAGKAVGILSDGVEGLLSLSTFTGVSEAAVNRFADGVRLAVAAMARLAAEFGVEAVTSAKAFAQAAGESTDFLKKGVDGFKKLSELTEVPKAGLAVFEQAVLALIASIIRLSTLISTQTLADATRLANATDQVITVVKDAIKAFMTLGTATDQLPAFVQNFVTAVTNLSSQFGKAVIPPAADVGAQIILAFGSGGAGAIPAATASLAAIGTSILGLLAAINAAVVPASTNIGVNISYGIANGISAGVPAIQNAVYAAVNAALAAARAALGIASPSTVFDEEIGQMGGAGLARGFVTSTPMVAAAADRMARASIAPAQAAVMPVAPRGTAGAAAVDPGRAQAAAPTSITFSKESIVIYQQPGESTDALALKVLSLVEGKLGLRGR